MGARVLTIDDMRDWLKAAIESAARYEDGYFRYADLRRCRSHTSVIMGAENVELVTKIKKGVYSANFKRVTDNQARKLLAAYQDYRKPFDEKRRKQNDDLPEFIPEMAESNPGDVVYIPPVSAVPRNHAPVIGPKPQPSWLAQKIGIDPSTIPTVEQLNRVEQKIDRLLAIWVDSPQK